VLPLSPNPGLTGGVHDGAGAGSGVGATGAGFRTGDAFLTGAERFGAAFFAGRFAARFAGFRAADFATFFFLRAGAAFFFAFVDFFFALAFFAMISPPDPSYEYENPIGPIGGRVHATIPTSFPSARGSRRQLGRLPPTLLQRGRTRSATRPVDQLDCMDGRDAGARGDLSHAANISRRDHVRSQSLDSPDFALAQPPCDIGLHNIVGSR